MDNLKPCQITHSGATPLHRAYIYLPATHWDALDTLRVSTTLSASQFIAHLIIKAVAAKETHETNTRSR